MRRFLALLLASALAAHVSASPLPLEDGEDEDFATRGFRGTHPTADIRDARGAIVWDFAAQDRLTGPAPATVNPSLWRHAKLLARHGLYEVHPRVFQVRGFDVSVMTVILGARGYILVDPLTTTETAAAALALVRRELGDRPVTGMIYTHSHLDHFGGAPGVLSAAEVAAGRVPVLAPEGFLEHAVSENLIAGNAMGRRALFQFGVPLAAGPEGRVSVGIGPALARGTSGLIPPTDLIRNTGDVRVIDGVRFEFHMTPHTEAPAEMNFLLPDFRVLCLAENANVTMHNVLTPRGALVRDTKAWADELTRALRLFGDRTDTLVTSHGWPRFGGDRVRAFIAEHRDAYKYLHDQSVRALNRGLTMAEVGETVELPPALAARWFNRGYYGTMNHNAKAVYQRYLGWYSGNPAELHRHPPEALGTRMVAALGGPARVVALARKAQAQGDDRFAVTLLDHLVFAGKADSAARALLAESYRRMAHAAEGALWRNMFLTAAHELANGPTPAPPGGATGLAPAIPTSMLLDLMAVRLVPERLPPEPFSLALVLPDSGERHLVTLRNGVMVHEANVPDPADLTVTLPRAALLAALAGQKLPAPPKLDGRAELLPLFLSLFETPPADFPIVTP